MDVPPPQLSAPDLPLRSTRRLLEIAATTATTPTIPTTATTTIDPDYCHRLHMSASGAFYQNNAPQ